MLVLLGSLFGLLALGDVLSLLGEVAELPGQFGVLELLGGLGDFLPGGLLGGLRRVFERLGGLLVALSFLVPGGPGDVLGGLEDVLDAPVVRIILEADRFE